MKLADDITIRLGGEPITLRPSLRFAMRLERRPGSLGSLARDVMDGSLTAACEIIRDHVAGPHLETRVFQSGIARLQGPLLAYVMALAGVDPEDAPANDNREGKPAKSVPFSDHLASLYRIGTGWLGWTPKDTLDATPAEISEAHAGRLELLKAVFGTAETAPLKPSDVSLDDKVKMAFGSFSTTVVKRRKAG